MRATIFYSYLTAAMSESKRSRTVDITSEDDWNACLNQESHGEELYTVCLWRLNAAALWVGLRAFMDAEHARYVGTVDVGIE